MSNLVEINMGEPFLKSLCCPVCGHGNFTKEADYCEHVLFSYEDQGGLGYDSDEGYGQKFEDEIIDGDGKTDQDHVNAIGLPPTAFVMSITNGGMACGPFSITAYFGFDLAINNIVDEEEEEQEEA